MKRWFAIAVVAELVLVLLLLHSAIKDFLWTHPWWHSFLVAVPTIALPILAYFELVHSGEANRLRAEANDLRIRANVLHGQVLSLTAELDTERNKHLQQIAKNTEKPLTQTERNAIILRKYLRAQVTVSEGDGPGGWPNVPEIVEVGDDNTVTLFTPRSYSSGAAWCTKVRCDELEISEIPLGSCPLRLKVLKRYGPIIQLGEITRWEDRFQPAATPSFPKGDTAHYSLYVKPGSAEKRSLYIYASADGANSFLLEASTGETAVADNIQISVRFKAMEIEYVAAGFRRTNAGTGSGPYPLFVA
jgi:hypothetical protein